MSHPSRYKILFCIRQGTIGGGESHLIDLIEFLDKEVYEPIVLSFSDGAMITHFLERNIATYVIHSKRPFDLQVRKEVNSLLDSVLPDLIHIHGTRAFSNLYFAKIKKTVPIVYTVHGWSFNSNQSYLRKFLAIQAERLFTRRSSKVINVSRNNQMTGEQHIKKFQSEVIHNGVNLTVFDKQKLYPSIRIELGIPADAFVIGFIARLTEQKDPFTLIHAFSAYSKENALARLLIVGDGDLKDACVSLVHQLNLQDLIVFQPFRKDIPALLQAIDIFCLPSLWEGFSIGLVEAMAMGKAVIATGVDGTLEILKDHENGLLIAKKDTQGLINKMGLLFTNQDLRIRLEAKAYKTISSEFSAHRVSQRTEAIYKQLLK